MLVMLSKFSFEGNEMAKNNSRMYYAVDLSLYHAEPLYIELDFQVSDYDRAIDLAVKKATEQGYIKGWDDVRCERQVYESMK